MSTISSFEIEHEAHIAADPSAVYRVFTGEIDSWWPYRIEEGRTVVRLDARLGGQLTQEHADGGQFLWATVTGLIEGGFIALTGPLDMRDPMVGVVQVSFAGHDGGTLVRLSHRAFGMFDPATRNKYDGGWKFLLEESLKPAVERVRSL